MVGIKGWEMPKSCKECKFFMFEGVLCGSPEHFLNTKCYLEHTPDNKDGWIGYEIEYGKYYRSGEHTVARNERWSGCRLVIVKGRKRDGKV